MGVLKSMDFDAPGAPLRVGELPRRVPHPQLKRSNGPDALFDIARLFFSTATWHPPRGCMRRLKMSHAPQDAVLDCLIGSGRTQAFRTSTPHAAHAANKRGRIGAPPNKLPALRSISP